MLKNLKNGILRKNQRCIHTRNFQIHQPKHKSTGANPKIICIDSYFKRHDKPWFRIFTNYVYVFSCKL